MNLEHKVQELLDRLAHWMDCARSIEKNLIYAKTMPNTGIVGVYERQLEGIEHTCKWFRVRIERLRAHAERIEQSEW